jgi:hypothetical protein
MAPMPVGFMCITKQDDAFSHPARVFERQRVEPVVRRAFGAGDEVRNWELGSGDEVLFPYDGQVQELSLAAFGGAYQFLWPFRTVLYDRKVFGGANYRDAGRTWFGYGQIPPDRFRTLLSLTFGEVATHNHFALDRGGKVFNRTAPVIKLPAGASEDEHLVLLAQLNSSTACFWLKQVCQNKGIGGRGAAGVNPEAWEMFFQFGGTKLAAFPLAQTSDVRLSSFARALDALASDRQRESIAACLSGAAGNDSSALRDALIARRERDIIMLNQMVGLQEELDWYCYRLYGVDLDAPEDELREPPAVPPLTPGARAFEVLEAINEAERSHAREEGKTGWFERHGWEPVTELGAIPEGWRAVTEARLARTAASRELGLLEQPTYKRRWYRPDYEQEEREAMALWLADRVEEEAKTRDEPFTVRSIAAALQDDPAVEAVATLYAGNGFDLDKLVASIFDEESVPNLKAHVFSEKGLVKRAAWERTWQLQHAEDAWDAQKKAHEDAISAGASLDEAPPLPTGKRPEPEVPPKYTNADYLKPHYWKHRGKLDVPKERFIAYTETPSALTEEGKTALYGWAGWDHLRRSHVLAALDERAEHAAVPLEARYGLLYGIQFLLPYVRWGDAQANSAADELTAITQWSKAHLPPGRRPTARKAKKAS